MNEARDAAIVQLYRSGLSLEAIGQQYGLQRQRIHQIVRRFCRICQQPIEAHAHPAHAFVPIAKEDRLEASPEAIARLGAMPQEILVDRSEMLERSEFLGVNLSEPVKAALREEAAKRGISMSAMTSDLLQEMLIACGYLKESNP